MKYASDNLRGYMKDCMEELRARNDGAINSDALVDALKEHIEDRVAIEFMQFKQEMLACVKETMQQELQNMWTMPLGKATEINDEKVAAIQMGKAVASAYVSSQVCRNIMLQMNAKVDRTRMLTFELRKQLADMEELIHLSARPASPDAPTRPNSPFNYDWKLPASLIENEYSES